MDRWRRDRSNIETNPPLERTRVVFPYSESALNRFSHLASLPTYPQSVGVLHVRGYATLLSIYNHLVRIGLKDLMGVDQFVAFLLEVAVQRGQKERRLWGSKQREVYVAATGC